MEEALQAAKTEDASIAPGAPRRARQSEMKRTNSEVILLFFVGDQSNSPKRSFFTHDFILFF